MVSETTISIAIEARKSISDFCINVCKSKCCKRGKLVLLNDSEINAIVGDKRKEYEKTNILTKTPNNFHHYDLEKAPCKNLDCNNKCTIHKLKERPRVCVDYPLFIVGNFILLSDDRMAVQNNLFVEYVKKLELEGLKKV